MRHLFCIAICATALSTTVMAQSSTATLSDSTVKSTESNTATLKELIPTKSEENIEITDAKIKADAGSLSKYSLKFNLSYYGPTFGDVSAKDQPNPDGSIGTYETSIGGSLGGRYRFDKKTTLSVGGGLKLIHPFHGMDRTDLNNPYISYDMTNYMSGIQMRNSFGASVITVPNYTAVGEYAGLSYDASFTYNIGYSGYAIGIDSSVGYYLYNRGYITSDKKASRAAVAVFPTLKYNFSDTLSINTSTSISFWNPRQLRDEFALLNKTVSQRLGLGYAYTRDIYLAPYINFYPDRLSLDRTTINFSTSFSVL
ncbi:MAG: hypothetical protein WA160_03870 [Pseudobdellovibrio sp.]